MRCFSFDPRPRKKYDPKPIGDSRGLHISWNASGILRFQFGAVDGPEQIVVELTEEESKQAAEFLKGHYRPKAAAKAGAL